MSRIVAESVAASQVVSPYLHLSDEMLEARVKEMHRNIIDNYLEMATLLAEWKRRKKDISAFRLAGVGNYLLKVGEKQMLPEVFDRFWPDVDLMEFFARLLPSEQREYMDGKTIPVATGSHGEQVLEMTIETIISTDKKYPGLRSQLFCRNKVNGIEKQVSIILEKEKQASKPQPETIAGVTLDRETGRAMVPRRMALSKEDLRRILKALGA